MQDLVPRTAPSSSRSRYDTSQATQGRTKRTSICPCLQLSSSVRSSVHVYSYHRLYARLHFIVCAIQLVEEVKLWEVPDGNIGRAHKVAELGRAVEVLLAFNGAYGGRCVVRCGVFVCVCVGGGGMEGG